MTSTTTAGADPAFRHLGVLPHDADDLVACLRPELSTTVGQGHPLFTVLDRPTGRRLREALDAVSTDAADGLAALVPGEVDATAPEELAATVREALAGYDRVLLVVQWPTDADPVRIAERERAFVAAFTGEPVTLVCAAPCAVTGGLAAVLRDEHPVLLERAGRRRPPDAGPRTLRAAVRGPADLRGVREGVARMAGGVGLDTEETAAAVLAVHEAAMLATGADGAEREGRAVEMPSGTSCLVEVRAEGDALVTEVTGPAAGPEPCLRVVRLFAADAEIRDGVHDGVPVRAVRVRSASA